MSAFVELSVSFIKYLRHAPSYLDMSILDWIAAGSERQARIIRMRKIRIDDSTPSPPQLDILNHAAKINQGHSSDNFIVPNDSLAFVDLTRSIAPVFPMSSLSRLHPVRVSNSPHIQEGVVIESFGLTSSPPPPAQHSATVVACCLVHEEPIDETTTTPDVNVDIPTTRSLDSAADVNSFMRFEVKVEGCVQDQFADADDVSSVSSCCGSSDSHPCSRKARKLISKRQSRSDARLMNCWLSTPKKTCQYLDLECEHISQDGSADYSTDDASILTVGFIDDDECKENISPDDDDLAFTKSYLPLTARALFNDK
jgi:hypothetical protein